MDKDFDEKLYDQIQNRFRKFIVSASYGMVKLREKRRDEEHKGLRRENEPNEP